MSGAPIPPGRRYDYSPVGAGADGRWPNGARLAVYVAVGVESYRFGEGHTEDLLPGVPAPDLVNAAWREYGNRVGAFRILERLGAAGIPPTVLLNTDVYDTAPAVTDAARRAGAEMVGHGLSNSDSLEGLDAERERAYLDAVSERIRAAEGAAPGGWSSPWLTQTERTPDLLAAAGYRYLLDLRFDDRPAWLRTTGAPLLAIPYALELNDSTSMIGRGVPPGAFAEMIVDELDELLAAATGPPLVMSVILHSFISGVPFRLKHVSRALADIAARGDAVWLTQPRRIHEAYARMSPPPEAPDGGR
ncbi:MAG TPA: polysaccharide deacetylase family protein [Miltoncostaea sp.]|nr:polysaccharide deacetylase family protein [Miltoncostaea sp.]